MKSKPNTLADTFLENCARLRAAASHFSLPGGLVTVGGAVLRAVQNDTTCSVVPAGVLTLRDGAEVYDLWTISKGARAETVRVLRAGADGFVPSGAARVFTATDWKREIKGEFTP